LPYSAASPTWSAILSAPAPPRAAAGQQRKEIAAGDVWITTGTDGQIAGVVALAPGEGRWPINPGLKQTKRDAIQSMQRRLIGIDKGIRPAPALDTD
jgi:hypothetical protein